MSESEERAASLTDMNGTFGSLVDPWYGCTIRPNKHKDYNFIKS